MLVLLDKLVAARHIAGMAKTETPIKMTFDLRGEVARRFRAVLSMLKGQRQEPARLTRHGLGRWLLERGLEAEEKRLSSGSVPPTLAR